MRVQRRLGLDLRLAHLLHRRDGKRALDDRLGIVVFTVEVAQQRTERALVPREHARAASAAGLFGLHHNCQARRRDLVLAEIGERKLSIVRRILALAEDVADIAEDGAAVALRVDHANLVRTASRVNAPDTDAAAQHEEEAVVESALF